MADLNILAPFILSFEGGYSCHPSDRGGATNKGVTLSTWRRCGYDKDGDGDIDSVDLSTLSDREVVDVILKPHYWDRCLGDKIVDQSLANIIIDWVWASGAWGIKHTQTLLGVTVDGVVGDKTLKAINSAEAHTLFDRLKSRRKQHFVDIAKKDPSQEVFLKGWLRRVEAIKYGELICNV